MPRSVKSNRVGPAESTKPASTPSARERSRLLAELGAAPENVTLEVAGEAVTVTHLDRVYWPAEPSLHQAAVTKRDLLSYLVAVAPLILPHTMDRPLTIFRWPTGIHGRRVLQKHGDMTLPSFVERTYIFSEAKGHADQYLLCNNLPTLLWLAHMAVLEFHVWHSRVRAGPDTPITSTDFASSTRDLQQSIIEYPDYILFDLDPFLYAGTETRPKQPELNAPAFAMVKDIARSLKALLDGMSLVSRVKTSGKTGLHVVVPIRRTVPYAVARELARLIASHLLRQHPREITLQWTVEKRVGKVFVDANMNVRGKSITAPFSPRGIAGAPVSMPFDWRELDAIYPLDFRVPAFTASSRKLRDVWADLEARKQAIEQALAANG